MSEKSESVETPSQDASPGLIVRLFRALGPALIVASVVLGPGSILSSSKVGAAYGFSMVWVLLVAAGLMMGMVALGARLGVSLEGFGDDFSFFFNVGILFYLLLVIL